MRLREACPARSGPGPPRTQFAALLLTSASAPASAPAGGRKVLGPLPFDPQNTGDQHLCNALPMRDPLRLRVQVDQRDADLPPVIAVDRAGGVDDADAA